MKANMYVLHHTKGRGTPKTHCPKCGSSMIAPRIVNDLLRATDPHGETFEIRLQLPVWRCNACKLCWQGREAQAAMETAYQRALRERSQNRIAAKAH